MPDVTPTITSAELRQKWSGFHAVIALDPGQTTGCAIVQDGEIECRTLDFWEAVDLVSEFEPAGTVVLIEDPGKVPPVFDRGVRGRRNLKIAQKVGRNKQDAKRLVERFGSAGFKTKAVRPSGSKWNRRLCQRLTGYDGSPNNQHVRDALRLLYQEGAI